MRTILALGVLVALTASASAGTVHHRRHVAPAGQTFAPQLTPRAAEGFAYVPRPVPYSSSTPDEYSNRYPYWGG
ncbi:MULTISPECIES: hypothetical protein [unclassified Bradyrhizobium]|uniref:hypothetical protein n=1 Tax=unclassified Bradyrhizobium TaxID=2631580 RepID=UPI0020B2557E|nr:MULTISPECIES: hypothetical protein [unclassified Bradyrhizobium]MCP3386370.1 hypothetical protein [Bradyrhizobium sp. CCGUVB4N]MCP3447584.1 hypothetical protein [Bradyrhizobium sp. CCGUVB14]WFU80139.1 hypothetical protein QA645_37520 [Bradyrhizobium sp. CIAT3101]